MYTAVFKMDNLPCSTGALLSVMWKPGWEGVWGRMDAWICTELLYSPSKTRTALLISTAFLISYIPIQSKK